MRLEVGHVSSRLWSVTTLLKEGIPAPALLGWAVKVTAEWAVDNADAIFVTAQSDREAAIDMVKRCRFRQAAQAAARGTDVHKVAESYALGAPIDHDPSITPYVDQYRRFLDDHQPEFEAAECSVFNLTYHYAGTLDAIVTLGGQRCVLDMKTTAKGPGQGARPPYPEVCLQLSAYGQAEFVGIDPLKETTDGSRRYYVYDETLVTHPMPEVEGALALVVSPVDYRLVPMRFDDETFAMFLYAREVARWSLSVSKTVIGPEIAAPAPVAA
jgi:hypothetical protein